MVATHKLLDSKIKGVNNHFGGSLNLTSRGLNITSGKVVLIKTLKNSKFQFLECSI